MGIKINKTINNLQLVWNQLDEASGNLYNALDNVSRMVDVPDEVTKLVERIDIGKVDQLRNEIEELIEEKKKTLKS